MRPARYRRRGRGWRVVCGLIGLACLWQASPAAARNFGLHSPGGRSIYRPQDTLQSAADYAKRQSVLEAVFGYAPEGNIGLSVGWLLPKPHGLELYGGLGLQLNPSFQLLVSARYLMNIRGYRPYIGAGYLSSWLTDIGTRSDQVFAEVGYSFKVRSTYHLTIGVGVRYLIETYVLPNSPLRNSDIDPVLRDKELDNIRPWAPTVAFRFSRAF